MKLRFGFLCIALFLFFQLTLNAQKNSPFSGYVYDKSSGERLIGATIQASGASQATVSNTNGYFALVSVSDTLHVKISYVGYASLDTVMVKNEPARLYLTPRLHEVREVAVTSTVPLEQRNNTTISQRLDSKYLKQIPSLLGEKDPMKALTLLPGVTMGSEGTASFYVRGGTPDQNLILLDGVPVYNISHVLGFFSVFIPETIKEVELIKGGFPARYGGRLSSIVDIRMKEGDMTKRHLDISVGTLASKLVLEGPLVKNKASYIIGARRTYADIFFLPFYTQEYYDNANAKNKIALYFWDISGKANYRINENNRIFTSVYNGRDMLKTSLIYKENYLKETSTEKIFWGNFNWIIRWHSVFSGKLFSSLSLYRSNFNYNLFSEYEYDDLDDDYSIFSLYDFNSRITDYGLKWELEHTLSPELTLYYGMEGIYHYFVPGISRVEHRETDEYTEPLVMGSTLNAAEVTPFIEAHLQVFENTRINAGLRYLNYVTENERFTFVEPRLSVNHALNDHQNIKFGITRMNQPLQLATSSGVGLPRDLWLPATRNIQPQQGFQIDAGYGNTQFRAPGWRASVNLYYKKMKHITALKEGATFVTTDLSYENIITQGQGTSYGSELLIEKTNSRLNGWFSYTLAKHTRQFDKLNGGKPFPFKYDKRHEIDVFANYELNDKVHFHFAWLYSSGIAFTMPKGRYRANNQVLGDYFYEYFLGLTVPDVEYLDYYESRHNMRLPAYHRLDAGVDFIKKKNKGVRTWNISIYNIYSRRNPYYVYWTVKNGKRELRQMSIFQVIPGITYNFKF